MLRFRPLKSLLVQPPRFPPGDGAGIAARAADAACLRAPSVLLITIDTLRADHVGCYGNAQRGNPCD